jgi:hypothetical protein
MENKKNGYNAAFWGLGAAAVAGIIGSAYYIYSLMYQEEDLSEADLEKVKELQQEIIEQEAHQGGLTVDTAMQIMAMTNKISEERIKKARPDLDDRRRAAINNPEEYERICQETLECKNEAYQESVEKVLQQFGGISIEEIHRVLQSVPPQEIEKINHKYEKPSFENVPIPDKKLVKEAYIFFGRKFQGEMMEYQRTISQMSQMQMGPEQQEYIFFKLMIGKMKVDDEVYIKYKYTEPQIKFMIHEYNLTTDPDVMRINDQLMRFEQMFAPPMEQ